MFRAVKIQNSANHLSFSPKKIQLTGEVYPNRYKYKHRKIEVGLLRSPEILNESNQNEKALEFQRNISYSVNNNHATATNLDKNKLLLKDS